MNNLPQHQRELDNLNFINDLKQYIVSFTNKKMVMRIPERDYYKFRINLHECLKLCECINDSPAWYPGVGQLLSEEWERSGYRELEFVWQEHVSIYLWCKFKIGAPYEHWFRHGNPCVMFEPPEQTEDTTYSLT